jgi:hypothetical protein
VTVGAAMLENGKREEKRLAGREGLSKEEVVVPSCRSYGRYQLLLLSVPANIAARTTDCLPCIVLAAGDLQLKRPNEAAVSPSKRYALAPSPLAEGEPLLASWPSIGRTGLCHPLRVLHAGVVGRRG